MVSQQQRVDAAQVPKFSGKGAVRELAAQIFALMRARGRFMADDAAIRVSVDSVAEFLTSRDEMEADAAAAAIEAAVKANSAVFAIEEVEGLRLVVTTRGGRAPIKRAPDLSHSFAQRLMTPLPKPERPPQPVRERPRVDPSWATLPALLDHLGFDDDEEVEDEVDQEIAAAIEPASPSPTIVEVAVEPPAPVIVPTAPVPAVDVAPPVAEPPIVEPVRRRVAEPVEAVVTEPVEVVVAKPAEPVVAEPTPAAVAPEVAESISEPVPAPVAEVTKEAAPPPAVERAEPVTPPPPPPPTRTITLPIAALTDVSAVDDADLAEAIRQRLRADTRVASFDEQWLMEDRVPRFSRGDLRRFKDYLQEQEQPLTDHVLAQDILGARPGTPEFELVRFAVNFRLQREHREFEFVGTSNQRFWSTTGLPQIGTTRRKPNEIGTDYRFLIEETADAPAAGSLASVDRPLSFYEYQHGLLPYDRELHGLLPAPLVPNQRAAVLTFECPQVYTTYLVELRYPTPNRGGFILGLDDFYTENLVPGALLSISRTENDGHYRVEYLAESGQSARLLELDERRAQRYVFRPTSFACGVDPEMLLTEERFGNLSGEKPVDEKVRRRPEAVVAVVFERVGVSKESSNYSVEFATLLAAVNVERPMSATLLRSVLENDDTGAFSRDPEGPDVYTYVPGSTP